MALNHLTQSLSELPSYVLPRRQRDFDYIKRVHLSQVHFLNVIALTPSSFTSHLPPPLLTSRTTRWYLLALSLGLIASMHPSPAMLRALTLLLDEFDHWTSADTPHPFTAQHPPPHTPTCAPLRIVVRRPLPVRTQQDAPAALQRVGKQVVYEMLQVAAVREGVSEALDYVGVVVGLLSVLHVVYGHLMVVGGGTGGGGGVGAEVMRVDRRVKALVVDRVSEDVMRVAMACVGEEHRRCMNGLLLNPATHKPYTLDRQALEEHGG